MLPENTSQVTYQWTNRYRPVAEQDGLGKDSLREMPDAVVASVSCQTT